MNLIFFKSEPLKKRKKLRQKRKDIFLGNFVQQFHFGNNCKARVMKPPFLKLSRCCSCIWVFVLRVVVVLPGAAFLLHPEIRPRP